MDKTLDQIAVPESLRAFVAEQVAKGGHRDAAAYVHSLLQEEQRRAAEEARKLEELRREIAIGIAQADRGETAPLDIEAIKAEGRRRLAQRTEPG